MAKIIFDSLTGTTLELHDGVFIVDTDELARDYAVEVEDNGLFITDAEEALDENLPEAHNIAVNIGTKITDLLG